MKKNNITLVIFLILGLVTGLIISMLIESVQGLSILTKSIELNWKPQADFKVITYDIAIGLKVNLLSLLGILGGFLLYRRL